MEVSAVIAEGWRGTYEVFLWHELDDGVDRLKYARDKILDPKLRRHAIKFYQALNRSGEPRKVFVLRTWEADDLRERLPTFIRSGSMLYVTNKWESIPLAWATKDLDRASKFPYVYDSTLPQHRLNQHEVARPTQNQFPVWYFLVGEASRPKVLQSLLKLDHEPDLRSATVHGLSTVHGPHCEGLVKSSQEQEYWHINKSHGSAYLVTDKLEEDRLRYFHTDLFRVIRCTISFWPSDHYGTSFEVQGLAFLLRPAQWALQSPLKGGLIDPAPTDAVYLYTPWHG